MKRKRYVEPLWPLSLLLGSLVCIIWTIFAFGIYVFLKDNIQDIESYILLISIACLCIFSTVWFITILPRLLSTLIVKNNCIIWHCPFRKTITMSVEDFEYVGLEDSSQEVYFRYSTQEAAYAALAREDFMVYIYFSKTPFPKKYIHRASAAPCKEGFIKFAYSEKLCLNLLEVLPAGKTSALRAFYNHMQAADRVNKLKQQNKKKRKSKKK